MSIKIFHCYIIYRIDAFSKQHLFDCDENHLHVCSQRHMIYVPDIQLEFLSPRDGITAMTLRPSAYARPNLMTAHLLFAVKRQVLHQQRPRSNQRHVALQHIYQLRQLVDGGRADKLAYLGQPVGIWQQITIGIPLVRHTLKLNYLDDFAVLSRTLLHKERPSTLVGEMQPHHHHYQDGTDAHQSDKGNPKVKESFKKMFIHIKFQ